MVAPYERFRPAAVQETTVVLEGSSPNPPPEWNTSTDRSHYLKRVPDLDRDLTLGRRSPGRLGLDPIRPGGVR